MTIQPLVAIDQVVNTLIYIRGDGFGLADETISARLFRCYLQGMISDRWYRVVDALFYKNHCYESWLSEVKRKQMPSIYSIS